MIVINWRDDGSAMLCTIPSGYPIRVGKVTVKHGQWQAMCRRSDGTRFCRLYDDEDSAREFVEEQAMLFVPPEYR